MQHSAFKDKGESVEVFANTTAADDLKVFQIDEDDVLTDITPTDYTISSIGGNVKKTSLTLPNEDTTVMVLLNGESVFMRVGTPKIRYTVFMGELIDTGKTIPFKRLDQSDGSIIEDGNLIEFGQGLYGFTPDSTGDSIIEVEGNYIPLRVPYTVDAAGMKGSIYLQKNAWMMLAVPKEDAKIYEDMIKPIEEQTGMDGDEIFEIFNAYPFSEGDEGSSRKFLSFVPGVTNVLSSNNFSLIYEDVNGSNEVTGFWCKTRDYEGDVITYNWDATT